MVKARTHAFKATLKLAKLLGTSIDETNYLKKRRALDKLERYFRPSKTTRLEPLEGKGFKGHWIRTPNSRPGKVTLYIHGGGFVFYPKLYHDMISRIAQASKTEVFALDYSLAPEHAFPKALHEAAAAYKWLLKTHAPETIAIAGDSAGGALVLSLIHHIKKQLPIPACVIALAPATDAMLNSPSFTTNEKSDFFLKKDTMDYFMEVYFTKTPRDDPLASPLYGSLVGFPPLLLHADRGEILYDDSRRFVEKAKGEGVEVTFYETEGLWHVFHLYARYVPEAKIAIQNIGDFIQKQVV